MDSPTPTSVIARRRRIAALLLVTGGLIFFVGVLLRSRSAPGEEADLLAPLAGEGEVTGAARPIERSRDESPRPDASPTRVETGRRSGSGRDVAATVAGMVEIELVDAEHDAPVGGARVHYLPRDRMTEAERRAAGLLMLDPRALVRERGQERTSDEAGRVRLPVRAEGALVVAEHGELFGWCGLRPHGPARVSMTLHENDGVRVRVVDRRGEGVAGVPIGLRIPDTGWDSDLGRVCTAGARGEAYLRVMRSFRSAFRDRPAYVALSIPLDPPVRIPLDPDPRTRQPVRLDLPATGGVVVHLARIPPDVANAGYVVGLSLADAGRREETGGLFLLPVSSEGRGAAVAISEHVGLGLELEAVLIEAEGGKWTRQRFTGPEQPGQTVQVTLQAQGDHPYPILTGQLSDPAGNPIVGSVEGQCVLLNPHGGARSTVERCLELDPTGRFRWLFDDDPEGWAIQVSFRRHHLESRELIAGSVALERRRLESRDLGSIVLRPVPVLVAGQVVDQQGIGIPDAALRCQSETSISVAGDWESGKGGDTTSDLEGRFVLHGEADLEEVELSVSHAFYTAPEPSYRFAVGDRDVSITLVHDFIIKGRVYLDPEISPYMIGTVFHEPWPSDQVWFPGRGRGLTFPQYLDSEGRFQHRCSRPGTASLVGTLGRTGEPVFSFVDLVLPPDDGGWELVLDPIDLRGRIRTMRVRVVDRAGDPLPDAWLQVEGSAGPHTTSVDGGPRSGEVELRTPRDSLRGWAVAPGHCRSRFEIGVGTNRVVLDDALHTRVVLAGIPWHEFPEVRLHGRLAWRGEGLSRAGPEDIELTPEASAVWTSAPGPHVLALTVEIRDGTRMWSRGLGGVPFEIGEQDGGRVVEIPAPVEEFRAAVEKLRESRGD